MHANAHTQCTAFEGFRRIDSGELSQVAIKTKAVIDRGPCAPVLIFDDHTSELVEVDFRGTLRDVLDRFAETRSVPSSDVSGMGVKPNRSPGPGRPKLGVVGREVTLLPRHWQWLSSQPGGASVALRKLVDNARRVNKAKDEIAKAQEVAYRFLSALAGNLPGFEEATRALFAGNGEKFEAIIKTWSEDVRDHTKKLTATVFRNYEAIT